MKFPILKAKPVFPSKPLCPQCKQAKVMEPHSMAILSGGALRVIDPDPKTMTLKKMMSAEMAKDCVGFLDLIWHGAHNSDTGVRQQVFNTITLAEDTPNGQFEFYFCSTKCLRAFFNDCVDELEKRMKRKSKRR